jgi:hypothetical protein
MFSRGHVDEAIRVCDGTYEVIPNSVEAHGGGRFGGGLSRRRRWARSPVQLHHGVDARSTYNNTKGGEANLLCDAGMQVSMLKGILALSREVQPLRPRSRKAFTSASPRRASRPRYYLDADGGISRLLCVLLRTSAASFVVFGGGGGGVAWWCGKKAVSGSHQQTAKARNTARAPSQR